MMTSPATHDAVVIFVLFSTLLLLLITLLQLLLKLITYICRSPCIHFFIDEIAVRHCVWVRLQTQSLILIVMTYCWYLIYINCHKVNRYRLGDSIGTVFSATLGAIEDIGNQFIPRHMPPHCMLTLFCMFQGYFGAMGCLIELLRTGQEPCSQPNGDCLL